MPFVAAKCTQCGANIEVDDTKEAGICKYCGTAFVTEKAVNNYNVTNYINAGVVNIYGGSEADFVVRAGMLEKYNGASKTAIIPNGVVEIGEYAFEGCRGLTSVTIPLGVTWIGKHAFSGCSSLTSIIIPDLVIGIRDCAFSGCSNLKSVIIPKSVTRIGNNAFCNCISLTSIIMPDSSVRIGNGAFKGCPSLTDVNLGRIEEIGDDMFYYCMSLKSVTIPNSVTRIGNRAFYGCTSLTSVTIPNSVTQIGNRAFYGCESLTSVTIPDSVTEMGFSVFCECPIVTINASENWKRENYSCFDNIHCLKDHVSGTAPQSNNGCYIATYVYGSYDCPQVWTLRRFRDYTLDETWYGRLFIKCYYAISPALVKWFGETKWFRSFWRTKLDRMVAGLNNKGIENTQYSDKY